MARVSQRPTLVIMVKAPVAGAVKTRLAREIGTGEALRFYRTATALMLRRLARDPRWRIILAVTPDRHCHARFWPCRQARVPQHSGDLGQRLQRLLALPGRSPTLIIGSDIPQITPGHIERASQLLRQGRAVFGPAEDGGYWLVGAARRPTIPRLFAGVRWSTHHALSDTVANVKGRVVYADRLQDVDTAQEWLEWRSRLY